MATLPGGGRILVLDDDVHVAETLQMILLARGYKVRVANSAEEAIETIAGWEPDLAIVDVMLPRMNGIEFGDVLRSNYPQCQLVLVSGHPGTSDLLETARRDGPSAARDPGQAPASDAHSGDCGGVAAGADRGSLAYRLAAIICAACCRLVSVTFAPLNILATS